MLSFFRRGITAKIMLGILAIGLFAIVITGFGTGGSGLGGVSGLGGSTVAKVGGESITTTEVQEEAQRQLRRLREQQPELDMARFLGAGGLEELVTQMLNQAAVVGFGREQGLSVSRKMVDAEIANAPAFRGLTGQFDPSVFQRLLQQEGISEAQLREDIARGMIQSQLLAPTSRSPHVPDAIVNQYASLLLESRTGIIGAVPTKAMGPGKEPTDQEVAAYYQKNRARYTIPERRVVRYALFGAEQVAAQAKATDAEIEAAYRQNPAYAARETRRLAQVVLPTEVAARALAQKVAAGMPFAQAAAQAGFSATDIAIGEQTREAYARAASAAVANAAFGAAKGATVGPVKGPIGWHVVRVEDVRTIAARPLAAVRAEIATQIEQKKAQNAVQDLATRIENAITEGASFAEIAQANGLQVRETVPVTATGAAPGNAAWKAPPELQPLLQTAFDMEPNEEPVVEPIGNGQSFALMTIGGVTAAAAPPLAQIRDQVKMELIVRRASDRARAVATSIASKINAGTPPAEAFAQAAVRLPPVQTVSATRREVGRQDAQVPPPLKMVFSLPRGKARLVPAPDGRGWFVVYTQSITPGDASKEPAVAQAIRGQFGDIFGEEYRAQFTAAAAKVLKVKRNDNALAQVKQQLGGGAAQ
jgi:peptidyl-prolyl cis-trans isomerase D